MHAGYFIRIVIRKFLNLYAYISHKTGIPQSLMLGPPSCVVRFGTPKLSPPSQGPEVSPLQNGLPNLRPALSFIDGSEGTIFQT